MNLPDRWRNFPKIIIDILIGLTVLFAAYVLWQWYQDGGGFEAVYVFIGVVLAGLLWFRRQQDKPLSKTQAQPATFSRTEIQTTIPPFAPIRQQMNQCFSLEELRSLAFDLNINYDNLAGQTLDGKIISLLTYVYHHNQLLTLETELKERYPHITWLFPDPQYLTPDLHQDRNRENYLNNLKTTWIDGFLYQSLHTEVIKLTMTKANETALAKEANRRSWHMVKQQVGQTKEPIPLDKPVNSIFQESGRGLLILGDPGSGKTITLLQLAETLITEAKLPGQPMPVILNLSSWAQEKQALTDWMVEEIFIQYSVSRDLARRWIRNNNFIYLLDSLDEVAADARDNCVLAINEFRATQPDTIEMIVCSRIADYQALTQKLNLNTAIQIQPLNAAQIDSVLQQSNLEMQAVRAMLKTDPPLRELTQSPLLLNVMMLAYQGKAVADLKQLKTVEARRQHLFDTYIDAMFSRRPLPNSTYSETDARHWLMKIAYGLKGHQVSEFYIEKLQPSWLPVGKPIRRYSLYVSLVYGLIGALLFGAVGGLIGGLIFGLFLGLSTGLLSNAYKITPVEKLHWSPPSLRQLLKEFDDALNKGLIITLIFMLYVGLADGLLMGLVSGLSLGVIFGLLICIKYQETGQTSRPNQSVHSSFVNALRMALLFGLTGGLIVGLIFGLSHGLTVGLYVGLSVVLVGGLIVGLITLSGLSVIPSVTS